MTVEFKLPDLGEQVEQGDVVAVLVSVGDDVALEQGVIEVETEKASMEVPSSVAGRVVEILVSVGDTVRVGQTLLILDASDEATAEDQAEEGEAGEETASTDEVPSEDETIVPLIIPDMGEGATSGRVVEVLVAVGDRITREQPVLEVESEKATVEIPSNVAGSVVEILVAAGDTVHAGQSVLLVAGDDRARAEPDIGAEPQAQARATDESAEIESPDQKSEPPSTPADQLSDERVPDERVPDERVPDERIPVFAAPSVRKFAREIGVDLVQVTGTGPGGKISMEDVKRHARSRTSSAPSDAPAQTDGGDVIHVPMNNVRKVTARTMAASWAEAPHVTLHRDAVIDQLEADRRRYKQRVAEAGGSLTVTAIMVKLCASALKVHPGLNAVLDIQRQELVQFKRMHIGVAVDTPRGLVVPVIRDVQRKSLTQVSVELAQASSRARQGKLGLDEMAGATFTVTNLGGLGIEYFTPIINPPQVAILGLGRARTRAEFIDGAFVPRLSMPLSLSFDHRAVDGADGARFLAWLCDAMESMFLTVLEG